MMSRSSGSRIPTFRFISSSRSASRSLIQANETVDRVWNFHFRGAARGYMTAGWWIPGEMKKNYVSWKSAKVPAKQETTFVFVGATSVLPSEFTRGPSAKLSISKRTPRCISTSTAP